MRCEVCGEPTFDYDTECKSCAVKRARREALKDIEGIAIPVPETDEFELDENENYLVIPVGKFNKLKELSK